MKRSNDNKTIDILGSWFESICFDTPKEYRNICIIPFSTGDSKTDYIDLKDEAASKVIITEIDESGSVPELKLNNTTDKLLFIIDSEEFVGAKQNRVANTSILVNKKSKVRIPVSCVEEGRWSYKSREFKASVYMMPHSMRSNKMYKVSSSLEYGRRHYSDQSEVWEDVRKFHSDIGTESATGALKDAMDKINEDLELFVKTLKSENNNNGFIAFINGKVTGMEFISRVKPFKHLEEKIIRSLASDALRFDDVEMRETNYQNEAIEFIDSLKKSTYSKYKSVDLGDDLRIKGEKINGSALIFNDELIHLVINNN